MDGRGEILCLNGEVCYLQFLNYCCHLSVVRHLSLSIPVLLGVSNSESGDVTAEDPGDEDAGSDLLLEVPFDFQHAPVGLDRDGCQSFFLSVFFRFANSSSK